MTSRPTRNSLQNSFITSTKSSGAILRRISPKAIPCLFSAVSLLTCAGCQPGMTLGSELQAAQSNLQSSLQQISANAGTDSDAQALQSAGDGATSITQTPLYHLFTDHPYNTQASFNHQFPRVALTVTALPAQPTMIWGVYQTHGGTPPNQCTTLSAKIWYSATSSADVPPFEECFPGNHPQYQGTPLHGIGDWAEQTEFYLAAEESTGNVRTAGPVPPDHPFPQGSQYQALYGNVDVDAQNVFGATMALVFLDMGFDLTVAQDRRAWVESIVPIEQQ